MTDFPCIMSAPMVLATLREVEKPGTGKTNTRRLAWKEFRKVLERDRARLERAGCLFERRGGSSPGYGSCFAARPSPWQRVKPGDRLWVRETWQLHSIASDKATVVYAATIRGPWTETHNQFPVALADGLRAPRPFQEGWRSPIHMPRWASRLTLHVTATKIERLQDIGEVDARAEGIYRQKIIVDREEVDAWSHDFKDGANSTARRAFENLWVGLHGIDAWAANPEVVAITFRPVLANIDATEARAA